MSIASRQQPSLRSVETTPSTRVAALRWVAIASALLNLGIHVYLAPMHLQEKPYIGVLFLIGSTALAVAVVGLASDQDRMRTLGWLLGTATSLAMLIAFVLSRTVGLPGNYRETWGTSLEDVLGLVAVGLEVALCWCCLASLTTARTSGVPGRPRWLLLHDRTAPLA